MSKDKLDDSLLKESNILNEFLNKYPDIGSTIVNNIPIKETLHLPTLSKDLNKFFQPYFDKRTAAIHVVEGNVDSLKRIIANDPSWLFAIYPEITAPRGQKYFNVSLFQLITFLCDDDMKTQIMNLDSMVAFLENNEKWQKIREQQYAQIACGGADLIKINFAMAENGIEGLTQYETTNTLDKIEHKITFPLLENPDGIICYQDKQKQKHFYYVNKNKNIIQLLEECLIPDECKEEFEQFIASFDDMEHNTGRRSSVNEHKLIEKVFKHTLVQQGILYEYQGNQYCDNRTPFNLIKALRKCIRLCRELQHDAEASKCWRDDVGGAQGEEIWLLQRICEKERPFYPLDINHKSFKRECMIICLNNNAYEDVSVFEKGVIKIKDFALSKATRNDVLWPATPYGCETIVWIALRDLYALCWLIENAKENVKEFEYEQELQTSLTTSI